MKPFEPSDWQTAWRLEDYLIDLFRKKKTHTLEFKTLLDVFGKPKIKQVWEKYQNSLQDAKNKVKVST